MLPNYFISSFDKFTDDFLYPRNKNHTFSESWELGRDSLFNNNDESEFKYAWQAWTDGKNIYCKREDLIEQHLLITDSAITEIDFTFDQNMRPHVTWVNNGLVKFRYYDSVIQDYKILEFEDIRNPRLSLDDTRNFNIPNSDIIFAYIQNNILYYRLQRDRYSVDYLLSTYEDAHKKILWKIGMGTKYRFLFYVR